jgi:hypothetical protein
MPFWLQFGFEFNYVLLWLEIGSKSDINSWFCLFGDPGWLAAGPAMIEQTTRLIAFRGFAGTSVLILVDCATCIARKDGVAWPPLWPKGGGQPPLNGKIFNFFLIF